ncbi:MAG: hypothetical protein PHH75_00295 [Candidatus Omnitrophica bacterium]|nr:hypothetical protein [Candidatus Omnitrophota bacterium]MDD5573605.1 hypothetical protein [Candidatus Omnitrophota bacterium]
MKKIAVVFAVGAVIASFIAAGCAKKAASSSEAISQAETMQTADQKVDYLVGQANAFLNSKEYDEAIKTAKYVLANLDKDSQEAQGIIEKAKNMLSAEAKGMMDDMKKTMGEMAK